MPPFFDLFREREGEKKQQMATDVTAFRFIFVALLIRLEFFSDPRGRKLTNQQLKRKATSAAQWPICFGNLILIFGWDITNGKFWYLKCFGVQIVCTLQHIFFGFAPEDRRSCQLCQRLHD